MYYEINIALNGSHLFATAERSIRDEEKLFTVLKLLDKKFPAEEGYKISCTYWRTEGNSVYIDEISGKIVNTFYSQRKPT